METAERSVLIVDDSAAIRRVLARAFSGAGWETDSVGDAQEALERLRRRDFSVMVLDVKLPGMSGLELLRAARDWSPAVETVIITAYGTIERAVEAMKNGAVDFLVKPFKRSHILHAAERALNRRKLHLGEADMSGAGALRHPIVGHSAAIRQMLDVVRRVASSAATVLIEGDSGSGKELVAEAIHHWSRRRCKPLVKVNCAAVPEALIEAELFGHERGAFTGAHRRRIGRFERADGGTIFLDEIALFTDAMQAKLLRVLQDGSFERLGGSQPIVTDVRVLAATNTDLESAVAEGAVRGDLYYRLNVVKVRVPRLWDRSEDVPLLVDHFLKLYAEKNAKPAKPITREALALLCAYLWPGNVRELENVIERAVVLGRADAITVEDLPDSVKDTAAHSAALRIPIGVTLKEAERRMAEETLRYTNGDKSAAARILGIARGTF